MSIAVDVGAGAFLTATGLNLGWLLTVVIRRGRKRFRAEHRARNRARQARAAVIEASLDDPWFALEEVRGTVDGILAVAAHVWSDGRLGRSGTARSDGAYIERWARSIARDLGEGVQMTRQPAVDVLGVVDRPGESEDRVVLRVRIRFRTAYPGQPVPSIVRADMRWTLGRKDHNWSLLSIDTDPLADPLLNRPLVSAAWADDERLREASLAELGADDAAPWADLSGLVQPDLSGPQQLVELAQLDGRFDPDLLGARLRHIVDAWEEASTGSPEPLAVVASAEAMDVLLSPTSADQQELARLVLRDAVIKQWGATKLMISAAPYRVSVKVRVSATLYVVRWPQGTYLTGDASTRQEIDLSWTLALVDTDPAAWQLIASNDPATGTVGV